MKEFLQLITNEMLHFAVGFTGWFVYLTVCFFVGYFLDRIYDLGKFIFKKIVSALSKSKTKPEQTESEA